MKRSALPLVRGVYGLVRVTSLMVEPTDAFRFTVLAVTLLLAGLLGMLNEDCFPGEISIERLTQAVRRIAGRADADANLVITSGQLCRAVRRKRFPEVERTQRRFGGQVGIGRCNVNVDGTSYQVLHVACGMKHPDTCCAG